LYEEVYEMNKLFGSCVPQKKGGIEMLKFKMLVLFVFVSAALLVGCAQPISSIRGSGNVVIQEWDISGFDRLDVSHGFKVDIHQGEAFSVVVRVADHLLDKLVVAKRGSTLRIGLRPGVSPSLQNATQEAEVTMPELTGLDLTGAPHATVSGFKSTNYLDVDLSGASVLRGEIQAGDARFDVSGASEVALQGSAGDLVVNARGASNVDLDDFRVADARVQASGASNVTVNASGILDAVTNDASDVYYVGNPRMGSWDTRSGGSSIRRK
jgi:hypothetical protein